MAIWTVFLSGFLALTPNRADACSCALLADETLQERAQRALSDSNAVFAGEVVDIDEPVLPFSSTAPEAVVFRVSEVWKGPERRTLEVSTAVSGASCGYDFERGRKYLVYATSEMDVGLCSETKPLDRANSDLAALGVGVKPSEGSLPETSGGLFGLSYPVWVGIWDLRRSRRLGSSRAEAAREVNDPSAPPSIFRTSHDLTVGTAIRYTKRTGSETLTHADVQTWLDAYISAWRSYDRDEISALFSEDATYSYHPWDEGDEVFRGRDAVVESWLDERDEPGSWEAGYAPLVVEGDRAVVKGFTNYANGDHLLNIWELRFDGENRCSEFVEWYMLRHA